MRFALKDGVRLSIDQRFAIAASSMKLSAISHGIVAEFRYSLLGRNSFSPYLLSAISLTTRSTAADIRRITGAAPTAKPALLSFPVRYPEASVTKISGIASWLNESLESRASSNYTRPG